MPVGLAQQLPPPKILSTYLKFTSSQTTFFTVLFRRTNKSDAEDGALVIRYFDYFIQSTLDDDDKDLIAFSKPYA